MLPTRGHVSLVSFAQYCCWHCFETQNAHLFHVNRCISLELYGCAFNRTTFIASSCFKSFEISSKENMYQIASELLGNLNIRNSLSRLFIISLYYHQKLSIFSQFVSFIDIVTSNSNPQPNLYSTHPQRPNANPSKV